MQVTRMEQKSLNVYKYYKTSNSNHNRQTEDENASPQGGTNVGLLVQERRVAILHISDDIVDA